MFSFTLSDWQQESINALKAGNNSLVTAPTGSGKSVPFEFAVNHFVPMGKKIIYTSPIKALSNQKFYELQNKFPDYSFGIITGDIKFNPEADVIIMTTEILRNNLYLISNNSNKLDFNINIEEEVACIVFDEVHYINDKDRGTIWEECFILAPKTCQFLMLSATIAAPEKFADWIKEINPNKETVHSHCAIRSVPLEHNFWITCYENKIMDKKRNDFDKVLNKPVLFKQSNGTFNDAAYHAVNKIQDYISNNRIFVKRVHVFNQVISYLNENELLPAISFIYSRKNVERIAKEVQCKLITEEQSRNAQKEALHIIKKIPQWEEFSKLSEYETLIQLVSKGVAIHHSGMLPILREIVEILFGKGYIKVLFATETFAVGINMPTKTAIFSDISKFDGSVRRYLDPHEYTQQAGRAGRRGYDTKGHVIHLCNLFDMPILSEYKHILSDKPQTLRSKFNVSYHLIFNLIKNSDLANVASSSMMNSEIQKELTHYKNELNNIDTEIENHKTTLQNLRTSNDTLNEYIKLVDIFSIATNKTKKNTGRQMNYMKEENKFLEQDYKTYLRGSELQKKRENQIKTIKNTENYINDQFNILYHNLNKTNFIEIDENDNKHLTELSNIALMFKEANCLTLTELLISYNFFENLLPVEIVSLLSLFASSSVSDDDGIVYTDYKELNKVIHSLEKINTKYLELENNSNIFSELNYTLCYEYLNKIIEWYKADTDDECLNVIRRSKHFFPGEFLKAILKVHNISKELEKIAEETQNLDLLEKTKDISTKLIKSVMTNHSLYV